MNLAEASVVRNRIGQFSLRDRPYIRARLRSVLHDLRENFRDQLPNALGLSNRRKMHHECRADTASLILVDHHESNFGFPG